MIAVFVNVATVLIGSLFGLIFRSKIAPKNAVVVFDSLGLVTIVIGIISAVATKDILCLVICMALGSVIGTFLKLDERIKKTGDWFQAKSPFKGKRYGKFTDGFVAASIMFCVGSMTVVGSFKAGIENDYSIIFAKSVLDLFSSAIFAAGMGIGVFFAAAFVLLFQGALTLLADFVAPFLSEEVVVLNYPQ